MLPRFISRLLYSTKFGTQYFTLVIDLSCIMHLEDSILSFLGLNSKLNLGVPPKFILVLVSVWQLLHGVGAYDRKLHSIIKFLKLPSSPESEFFGVTLYILYLVSPDVVGQAEFLQARKANSYPKYVSIPIKISYCSFQSGKDQINRLKTNWLTSLLEV